jgi:hypothetical protein
MIQVGQLEPEGGDTFKNLDPRELAQPDQPLVR